VRICRRRFRGNARAGIDTEPIAAGAPVTFDDDFPGMRRFCSEDPHGNRLEFLERRAER
jgi:hypothetical protein